MDLKETGKKLKPFAPVLSVAVVASCVAGSWVDISHRFMQRRSKRIL